MFVAFVFSEVPAYRQLGYLTSISLVLSLLAALFILPNILRPGGRILGLGRGMSLQRWGKITAPLTIVAAMLVIAAIFISRKIKFDSDITRLDGVRSGGAASRERFPKNLGTVRREQALLVVTARTKDAAEQANDEVYKIVAPRLPEGQFVSLSSIWPSPANRRATKPPWQQFWSPRRISDLRRDLAAAGEPYGFSANAFQPFFQSLSNPPTDDRPPAIISSIEDQFTARSKGDWQMLSYFDDTPQSVAAVEAAIRGRPDAEVVCAACWPARSRNRPFPKLTFWSASASRSSLFLFCSSPAACSNR